MCFNNKTGSDRGFYSRHFESKLIIEMEASIIAKMVIDKFNGFCFETYLLISKSDRKEDW